MKRLVLRLFFKFTVRRWNAVIASTLLQMHQTGVINSKQLHLIAHEFDPTQSGRVGRLANGGPNTDYTSYVLRHQVP